ncbi:MAG: Nramp family divalent metal transporter [Acidobacteria bacterium]|nr:Nramp family divalent metal transporter [Acidobacteriota bacterium]
MSASAEKAGHKTSALPISSLPETPSLPEVFSSVGIPEGGSWFRKLFAFAGPAYLVSVGYMDPGNWATDIEGGARFGYQLVWVLLLSNWMAILLQTLASRLGLFAGRDLAQACRDYYSRPVALLLWILCEIAIVACDLAEVLGSAIGLNLLFGIPLMAAVVITAADVLLLLALQKHGIRKMEAFIVSLVFLVGLCYVVEIFLAKPEWGQIASATFHPSLAGGSLYVAIGILGATVMPHNLYLHSALVQSRRVSRTESELRSAAKYNLIDSALALNLAFFVNAAILIMSAAVFYRNGVLVTEISQAHSTLAPLVGTTLTSTLFAIALLCAGQSSTITGTLAGQIVMEGFLRIRIRPWLRRLITRSLAIIPAVIVIAIKGEQGTYQLLILSQVILSFQLPFAIVPLVQFTSSREKMGRFANPAWLQGIAWLVAGFIISLNLWLLVQTFSAY